MTEVPHQQVPQNVADLLTDSAQQWPDAAAVIHPRGTLTYSDLDRLTWALCSRLLRESLNPGDVVGIHVGDTLSHLAWLLALGRCGMPSVALPRSAGNAAAQQLLRRTVASAVISDQTMTWDVPKRIHSQDILDIQTGGEVDSSHRCTDSSRVFVFKASSGTTGAPKLVPSTHAGMLASIAREQMAIGYPPGERYMTPVDISHDGPRRRFLACLAGGGTLVLPPARSDAQAWAQWIRRFEVRHFSCVPVQGYQLAAEMAGRERFEQFRCLRLSAGPSDQALHKLLRERLTPNVLVSYGCTEIGPMTVAPPDLLARMPDTVGQAMPGVEVEIVDSQGRLCAVGDTGQVRVRAIGMPTGYHEDPSMSAQAFRAGWFYPGDLGRLDPDGHLFHLGRADDVMVFNGINIAPAEIERAMLSHPAVADATAMPLKRPVVHEVPVCAVALNPGGQASKAELLAWARQQLGARSPRDIVILEVIPRNSMGKPLRQKIMDEISTRTAPPPGPAPLRQLRQRIKLSFVAPSPLDRGRLEGWTALLRSSHASRLRYRPRTAEEKDAADTLGYDLTIAYGLLHALGVPMFDEPVIEVVRQPDAEDPGRWVAQVVLPLLEGLPPGFLEAVLSEATMLRHWALAHAQTESGIQAFYKTIEERVLSRLGGAWPVGKSTLPVLHAAWQASIPFLHLAGGVFQLGWGKNAQRIFRSISSEDRAIGGRLTTDKALAATLIRRAGLPGPEHRLARDLPEALSAARQLGWPLVAKPRDRDRGEGVTVDIADETSLRAAFEVARQASPKGPVIIERQVRGVCHRLFVAQGRLLYAVKRLPMSIRGDGRQSVAALVTAEVNRQMLLPPWKRSGIVALDKLAAATLARQGYDDSSVVPEGLLVPLRPIETTAWGGVDEDVSSRVHLENLGLALAAAGLFNLDMAGVDIISEDIGTPWHLNGAIVNEVNYSPLLGGGEISRSYLPAFLTRLLKGNGRIPVEVFAGGPDGWKAAASRWESLRREGVAAWISDSSRTFGESGEEVPMLLRGLHARTRALLMSASVGALILVVNDDEFLDTGLPLECVDSVHVIDRNLDTRKRTEGVSSIRIDAVIDMLEKWKATRP